MDEQGSSYYYDAFDVFVHRGRNVLRLPLEVRRELLDEPARIELNSPSNL